MHKLFSKTYRRILAIFLAGLVAILPLVITIGVIIWVANLVRHLIGPDSFVGGWIQSAGMQLAPASNTTLAYLLGGLLVVAFIFLLGILVRTGFNRFLKRVIETLMRRIPIAGSVYGAATQVAGLLEHKDKDELKNMRVVYCMFGAENGSGILALLPTPDRYPIDGKDYHLVYLPTSPIPMTGGLLFTPAEWVKPVDMSVESLMSIYLSMGVTAPDLLKDKM